MLSTCRKLRMLGEGGMGQVWLVADSKTRVLYAAKYLRADLFRSKDLARFHRELETLRDLEHENIIKIFDTDLAIPAYLMEYCPDGDVACYLSAHPDADKAKIILQLAKAVRHLHERGFIHRDIKPQNVLIAPDGTVRLSDFGLAVPSSLDRPVLTSSNWVSLGFAPPEQYRDMASVTHKADIFAIGAVYFYLLTGRTFDLDAPAEPQLDVLNDFCRAVIEGALARDPVDRLSHVSELITMLEDYIEHNLAVCFGMPPEERLDYFKRRCEEFMEAKQLFIGEKVVLLRDMRAAIQASLRYERNSTIREVEEEYLRRIEVLLEAQMREDEEEYPRIHKS